MENTGRIVLHSARWLTLAVIFLVPWPYACIPRWTHPWLCISLFVITGLWAAGLIVSGRRPAVSLTMLVTVGLLLAQGWLVISNAQYSYDRLQLRFIPAHHWWTGRWVPGALDTVDAIPRMLRITGLLTVLCVITDMAANPLWRERLLRSMLMSGVSLTIYGLAQRALGHPLLLWREADMQHNLFASFYYHGNAGAFLNLLLPLLMGYSALAFREKQAYGARAAWLTSVMLTLAAIVAVASKAAMLVTVVLVVGGAIICIRFLIECQVLNLRRTWWQFALGGVLALVAVIIFGFERAAQRWQQMPELSGAENPRIAAWRACLRMLADAGPWGIGPGNFQIAFPHYTKDLPATVGIWEYAHQDYLQTLIEWGWWGAALWAVLLFGALWRSCRFPSGDGRSSRSGKLLKQCAGLALAGVLLHSLVDFPLQIATIQLFAMTLIGLLWAENETRGTTERYRSTCSPEKEIA